MSYITVLQLHEEIHIGETIIKVKEIKKGKVQLYIKAPKTLAITKFNQAGALNERPSSKRPN